MNTRVFRLNLGAEADIAKAIADACDKQLQDSFKLASTFVWGSDLIMIFQKL